MKKMKMKNNRRTTFILWLIIIPAVFLGQNDTEQLFEPRQVKADIDTLISKMKDVHPTFLNYYTANNLQGRIDSIKKSITKPMFSLDFYRIMQPIVSIDGHTSLLYNGPLCDKEEKPLFPFKVIIFNKELYIHENLSTNETLVKGSVIEKINGVRHYGAEVILAGTNYDEAYAYALSYGKKNSLTFVHPFEDEEVIAGQGTLALDILDSCSDLDAVVIPVGGGGLIAGMSTAIKSINPNIEVIGVSAKGAPAFKNSYELKKPVDSILSPNKGEPLTKRVLPFAIKLSLINASTLHPNRV